MAKKQGKAVRISRRGLIVWCSLALFVAAWMFVLGILVGRGYAPVDVDTGKLEQELADLKEAMAKKEQAEVATHSGTDGDNPPELRFFNELREDKSSRRMKIPPQKKSKPVSPKPAQSDKRTSPPKPPQEKPPATVAKPPAKTKLTDKPKPSKGHFTIQVAAVKIIANAEKLVGDLRKKGYPAYQVRVAVPGKGDWYRVRVGAFENRAAADQMLKKLKANKINGMVINTD